MKKTLLLDIETDSLNATKIHCIGTMDLETMEEKVFTDGGAFGYAPLSEFNDYLATYDRYVAHNGISFDFRILNKLLGTPRNPSKELDTLVISRLCNQPREGGHSLGNWGSILGDSKLEFNDFSTLTEDMIKYMQQDVRLLRKVFLALIEEAKHFCSKQSITLEHKVADICERMKDYGWLLDTNGATELLLEMTQRQNKLEVELTNTHPKVPKFNRVVKRRVKADGTFYDTYTKPLANYHRLDDLVGDYSLLDWLPFNPGSRQQIVYQLLLKGWEPTSFTDKGQPKVDEETLEDLELSFPQARDLITYLMLGKRIAQVRSWLELANKDTGRVHSTTHHIGARTHRASHADPNMAQVPAAKHDTKGNLLLGFEGTYNADCRKVWICKPGYKIVGVDADAIQLVVLAHAMGDPEFTEAVSKGDKKKGTDVHTFNRNLLRDIAKELTGKSDDEVASISRDTAKTFIYAFLLGAGGAKLASVVGLDSSLGAIFKERYLQRMPYLKRLLDNLRKEIKQTGKIKNIDGRYFPCDNPHFALSYVLQGTEQTIMKMAMVKVQEYFDNNNLDAHLLAWVHDEFQIEVREDIAENVRDYVAGTFSEVAKELNMRCPLSGTGAISTSWLGSH